MAQSIAQSLSLAQSHDLVIHKDDEQMVCETLDSLNGCLCLSMKDLEDEQS